MLIILLLSLAQPYDLLIAGGRVLDGSGNPAMYADVAVRDGKIAAVGRLGGAPASRTIDAKGKFVCPGFIDLHSHADRGLASEDPRRRSAPNLVSQGITTVCVIRTAPLPGRFPRNGRLTSGWASAPMRR